MTAVGLHTANRSAAFLSNFIDALDKAINMAKAIHHDSPNAADMKKSVLSQRPSKDSRSVSAEAW